MNITTEIRQLLGPLDPALQQASATTPTAREQDLAHILASGRQAAPVIAARLAPPPRRSSRQRTWWVSGLAAVAVVVALAVVVGLPGKHASSAYAATPAALHYSGAASGVSARSHLLSWAAKTKELPAAPPSKYQHLLVTTWSLTTRIDNHAVTSAVVPITTETFRAADNSGRLSRHYDPPTFASTAARARWQQAGSPGSEAQPTTTTYNAGQFPHMFASAAPAQAGALQSWLAVGHPAANGPAETLIAATDLAKEQVLSPAQRAAMLQVLATVPGLTDDGSVVDRAGRAGEAFSLTSDYSGLPTRYTLIIDPSSGQLLGLEETLTETAGALDVPVPSVIEYEVYRAADYRSG
jgi:hypothetical protein